ncbi:MAG: membrane integrity-associated transporter subunit PqiC [Xanthomonadaceae bacterium]|nr:membrane integrity-associated transporter subunit PqiC [Xanthomonadaceae bacterium]
MNPLPRISPALLLAMLLAGCSSLIGGPKETPKLYAPQINIQPDPAWPQVAWSLATSHGTSMPMLEGPGIVVSPTPGELQVYRAALWARTPGEMVEDSVLRTLEASGRIAAVARQSSGMDADYRLLLEIREFRADDVAGAQPAARLEINAKLLHMNDQTIVGNRSFQLAQPAATAEVASVVTAFGLALDALAPQIAGWALATGQAHEQATHKSSPRR